MGKRLFRAAVLGAATVGYAWSGHAQPVAGSPERASSPSATATAAQAPVSLAGNAQLRARPPVARPQEIAKPNESPRAAQPGLVLSVGLGTSYVGLGAQAGYVIPFESSQLSLVGAIGFVPGAEQAEAKVGFAAGLQAGFGVSNRMLIEVGVSPGVRRWELHGVAIAHELVYGPYAQVSYEYQWEMGLVVRLGGGLHAPLVRNFSWVPALSTGVGWKF